MSEHVQISPRDLWWSVAKIVTVLTFGLVLVAYILTELVTANDSPLPMVGLIALLLALAVNILATAFLTILKIIDWFENRRSKREVAHG